MHCYSYYIVVLNINQSINEHYLVYVLFLLSLYCIFDLPMRGIDEAAGGVDSANNNKRTKKATKIFIPEKRVFILIKHSVSTYS